MDNKLVEQYRDFFRCPDTREDLLFFPKDATEATFINKYETRFLATKGFVDFVGHNTANKVTRKKVKDKVKTLADHYENFIESADWLSNTFNSIVWGTKLEARMFQKAMKVFLTELQEGIVLDLPVLTADISAPVYAEFRKMTFFSLDYSTDMLNSAYNTISGRLIENVVMVQADPTKLPLKDGLFSAVSAMGGINFFKDYRKSIGEIYRVMKENTKFSGIAYVAGEKKLTDTIIEKVFLPRNIFPSVFTKEELKTALTSAGFKDIALSRFQSDSLVQFSAVKTAESKIN